ncbi:TATA element modulatory factor 1 TATA binding-domain-containing protein [Chytriomyces sp. MP71]|nr:TATA element modulatory factor 1 TATA binding-domain-containing protein [Chytriomyces sp. MP71]
MADWFSSITSAVSNAVSELDKALETPGATASQGSGGLAHVDFDHPFGGQSEPVDTGAKASTNTSGNALDFFSASLTSLSSSVSQSVGSINANVIGAVNLADLASTSSAAVADTSDFFASMLGAVPGSAPVSAPAPSETVSVATISKLKRDASWDSIPSVASPPLLNSALNQKIGSSASPAKLPPLDADLAAPTSKPASVQPSPKQTNTTLKEAANLTVSVSASLQSASAAPILAHIQQDASSTHSGAPSTPSPIKNDSSLAPARESINGKQPQPTLESSEVDANPSETIEQLEVSQEGMADPALVLNRPVSVDLPPQQSMVDTPVVSVQVVDAQSMESPPKVLEQEALALPVPNIVVATQDFDLTAKPESQPIPSAIQATPVPPSTPDASVDDASTTEVPPRTEADRLTSIISQREAQLLSAITANAALTDDIARLRAKVENLEQFRGAQAEGDVAAAVAVDEFSRRLEAAEKAGSMAMKDRDKYKQSLATLQVSFDDAIKRLADREEKVKSLLDEGEKLSKNELKMSTIVKKLRAKEAETEKEFKEHVRKCEVMSGEITELKDKLARTTESERKLGESVKGNAELNDRQAKLIVKLEHDLQQQKAELTQHKALLERARADLAEAKTLAVDANSAAHAEALEKEISANEALHKQLQAQQKQFAMLETALQKEVFDLRSTLARVEDESNWKEDSLRKEISSLQNRLQAAESRHEDLFAEARAADRPLVRQIESLQVQHAAARKDWEQIEISLTSRMQLAEKERFELAEKEKASLERYDDLNKRFVALEYQFTRERQERSRLQAELEEHMTKLDGSAQTVSDLTAKLSVLKASHQRALDESRTAFDDAVRQAVAEEKTRLDAGLKEERERMQRERARLEDLKVLAEKTQLHPQPHTSLQGVNASPTAAMASAGLMSPTGSMRASMSGDMPMSPLTGSVEFGAGSGNLQQNAVVERLYHNLKQMQGQISSLQLQLHMVTKTRDELAEELVKTTSESSDTKTFKEKVESLELQMVELNRRYNAALEMLGEKTELVEELQERITELKRIQKAEIEEIMRLRTGSQ